jgi:hypothetical protein
MKKLVSGKLAVAFLLLVIAYPLTITAVSYPTHLFPKEVKHDKFKKGDTAYLFYSGTNDFRAVVHVNKSMIVYRIDPYHCVEKLIGVIKVTSYLGEIFIRAEVLEGEVKPFDIAKSGDVSCMVLSNDVCER